MNPEELKYYSHPKMQEKFREAMGELQPEDRGLDKFGCLRCYPHGTNNITVCLPLPIDPVNPERGLWGMVDGFEFIGQPASDSWEVSTYNGAFEAETPTLALLKALAFQWQIDVDSNQCLCKTDKALLCPVHPVT